MKNRPTTTKYFGTNLQLKNVRYFTMDSLQSQIDSLSDVSQRLISLLKNRLSSKNNFFAFSSLNSIF